LPEQIFEYAKKLKNPDKAMVKLLRLIVDQGLESVLKALETAQEKQQYSLDIIEFNLTCLFSSIQTIVPIASGQAFLKYPDTVPAASGHHYRQIRPTAGTLCLKFNIDN